MELAAIVFSVAGFLGVTLTAILTYEIRKTRESIELLNSQVAVVISKVELHENRIDRHEGHILKI